MGSSSLSIERFPEGTASASWLYITKPVDLRLALILPESSIIATKTRLAVITEQFFSTEMQSE
ncbi:hypothetical protein [Alkalicoccus luteus]|uniref:hypothetical protein n=1 Tax=Alkalicoccus luteus TaxID=1237094 RepID=UPI00143C3E56|nr:hypothetical protein [Alkalicoccus luteus]